MYTAYIVVQCTFLSVYMNILVRISVVLFDNHYEQSEQSGVFSAGAADSAAGTGDAKWRRGRNIKNALLAFFRITCRPASAAHAVIYGLGKLFSSVLCCALCLPRNCRLEKFNEYMFGQQRQQRKREQPWDRWLICLIFIDSLLLCAPYAQAV